MKKLILVAVAFFAISSLSGFSQIAGPIHYSHGELFDQSGNVIVEPQVITMLGDSLYKATYLGAHRQYKTGMTLVKVGIPVILAGMVASVVGTIHMIPEEDGSGKREDVEPGWVALSVCGYVATFCGGACICTGIPLASLGKGRLSWIADEYNVKSAAAPKEPYISLGPCRNGLGIAVNF